jgi:hypothetical protein
MRDEIVDVLLIVAEDVEYSAPWHGWSVYGRRKEGGTEWVPAVELCTEEVASDLILRAERTFEVTSGFLKSFG